MDGRGRALDNVFGERLWRSVKFENISLYQYDTVRQLHTGLSVYIDFYNHERPHPSECTLSFSFRGPKIGAHHRTLEKGYSKLAPKSYAVHAQSQQLPLPRFFGR